MSIFDPADGMNAAQRMQAAIDNRITERDGVIDLWMFSPQVGGYGGVMRVRTERANPDDVACFTIWIWHDGEFPHEGDESDPPQRPFELHGCSPLQWLYAACILCKLQGMIVDEVVQEVRDVMGAGE